MDADWDGQLLWPTNPLLQRSLEIMAELRSGTSPYVGKQLRALLVEAGFEKAWNDWSAEPGGFLARFWCEAVGFRSPG